MTKAFDRKSGVGALKKKKYFCCDGTARRGMIGIFPGTKAYDRKSGVGSLIKKKIFLLGWNGSKGYER